MPENNLVRIYGKGVRLDKVQRMRSAAEHTDGFFNRVTGLGTARDKAKFSRFERNRRLSCEELDALYSDDDMASRVCDVVPDEDAALELPEVYRVERRDAGPPLPAVVPFHGADAGHRPLHEEGRDGR